MKARPRFVLHFAGSSQARPRLQKCPDSRRVRNEQVFNCSFNRKWTFRRLGSNSGFEQRWPPRLVAGSSQARPSTNLYYEQTSGVCSSTTLYYEQTSGVCSSTDLYYEQTSGVCSSFFCTGDIQSVQASAESEMTIFLIAALVEN